MILKKKNNNQYIIISKFFSIICRIYKKFKSIDNFCNNIVCII